MPILNIIVTRPVNTRANKFLTSSFICQPARTITCSVLDKEFVEDRIIDAAAQTASLVAIRHENGWLEVRAKDNVMLRSTVRRIKQVIRMNSLSAYKKPVDRTPNGAYV